MHRLPLCLPLGVRYADWKSKNTPLDSKRDADKAETKHLRQSSLGVQPDSKRNTGRVVLQPYRPVDTSAPQMVCCCENGCQPQWSNLRCHSKHDDPAADKTFTCGADIPASRRRVDPAAALAEIKQVVKNCEICQSIDPAPARR